MKQVYLVPHRCMGCEECLVSCEKAHDWETRAFVEILDGYYPLPMRCNHCQDAPCQEACPRDAIKRSATGAVVADQSKCIGCGACSVVCPFGVPAIDPRTNRAYIEPAGCQGCGICASVCPRKAIRLQHHTDSQILSKVSAL